MTVSDVELDEEAQVCWREFKFGFCSRKRQNNHKKHLCLTEQIIHSVNFILQTMSQQQSTEA